MTDNLTPYSRAIRLVVGFGIIGAVLGMEQMPTWLLLLSPYPVITGVIDWDPFYAIFKKLNMQTNNSGTILPHDTHNASA